MATLNSSGFPSAMLSIGEKSTLIKNFTNKISIYFLAIFCNKANMLKLDVRTERSDGSEQLIHFKNVTLQVLCGRMTNVRKSFRSR